MSAQERPEAVRTVRPDGAWRWLVPIVPAATALILALGIVTLTKDEVFFSGDGGLKYLLVRQFASGHLSAALRYDVPPWVEAAWRDGFYPFAPPFVYSQGDEHKVTFSFLFPLLSVPGYAVAGFEGLFLLPALALVLLAWRYLMACHRLKIAPWTAAASWIALLLGSPLIVYGLIFWEHTLSTLLVFVAAEYLVSGSTGGGSRSRSVAAGGTAGLAVWLRPEAGVAVASVVLVAALLPGLSLRRSLPAFAAGALALALGFAVANQIVYGDPLGLHSLQVLQRHAGLTGRMHAYARILGSLLGDTLVYYPASLWILAVAFVPPPPRERRWIGGLLAAAAIAGLATPLILPNEGGLQWGPRYYLNLLPLLGLGGAVALDLLARSSGLRGRALLLLALLLAACWGLHRNLWGGGRFLHETYAQRGDRALLEAVRGSGLRRVAVSHQFIAQALAATHETHTYFLAGGPRKLHELGRRLGTQGESEFLYLALAQHDAVSRSGGRIAFPDSDAVIACQRIVETDPAVGYRCSLTEEPPRPAPGARRRASRGSSPSGEPVARNLTPERESARSRYRTG